MCRQGVSQRTRLIPAWAGKTLGSCGQRMPRRAHPRVGGENRDLDAHRPSLPGSSPRGRGKRQDRTHLPRFRGLIPAWAGKTLPGGVRIIWSRAHPRVGGENLYGRHAHLRPGGSSPRGRGKHFLTCAFIKRIGQILETLELAVSSGSYSLCDVYATDAPQDQARNTGLALPSSRAAS